MRSRRWLQRIAAAAASAIAVIALTTPGAHAVADPYDTPLTLLNGWTDAPFGTQHAGVKQLNDGIVTFTGAIANGTNVEAFTLPPNDWPASDVYLPVDMCGSAKGRLEITPNGVGIVMAQETFSKARCFTSLDGVSFALPSAGSNTPLTLQNGWHTAPYGNAPPGVQLESFAWLDSPTQTRVHLTGAISAPPGDTNAVVSTLPPAFRPSTERSMQVDMCNATPGMLTIKPDGTVSVHSGLDFSMATCFTSLDGVWFTLAPGPLSTQLVFENGWEAYPYGPTPAVDLIGDSTIVFTGSIQSPVNNPVPFTIPSYLAPPTTVYVSVTMCQGSNGRLMIQPSGAVTIQFEGEVKFFACNTALDGVSYSLWRNPPS